MRPLRLRVCLALLVVLVLPAAPATAAAPSRGTLYAKPGGAALLQKPDPKAKKLAQLKGGEAVRWFGAAPGGSRYHQVETATGKTGFVLLQQLTPYAVARESVAGGRAVDAQAFASGATGRDGRASRPVRSRGEGDAAEAQRAWAERLAAAERGLSTAEALADSVRAAEAQDYGCRSTGGCR